VSTSMPRLSQRPVVRVTLVRVCSSFTSCAAQARTSDAMEGSAEEEESEPSTPLGPVEFRWE
jgi:hypothetical protein